MTAKLTFCGGAGSVTGANFLLETESAKILVDCGTVEDGQACGTANFEPFAYDPRSINALFVTHAHADHIGKIPKLVRNGFRGTIYSTPATKDLAALMFDDALGIMREHAQEHGCELLYEKEDADRALSLWQTLEYHRPLGIGLPAASEIEAQTGDIHVELFDAGHILGSALVKFSRNDHSILFTGDLGNTPEPLLNETEYPSGANYIVMESVYGDRIHEGRAERREKLKAVIEDTRERKATLLIPSFSIERTQILLYEMNSMVESGEIGHIPVVLDAPLAARVTEVFKRYSGQFNPAVRARIAAGDDVFAFPGLSITHTTAESRAIHNSSGPQIIIAGAGMSAGGRIRAHEREYLGDKKATILFVGYQAVGSLGRRIQEGVKKVRIDDEYVRIHARVETLTGYSGHADRDMLLDFLEKTGESLEKVFVTMGEPRASMFFAQRAKDFLGLDAVVPQKGDIVSLDF